MAQQKLKNESEKCMEELGKLENTCKSDFGKMHQSIKDSAGIRDEVRFLETRIGLIVQNTLTQMFPKKKA